MFEGLLHRNRCAVPISLVYSTPLTAGSIISLVYRSRYLWCKVVVERLHEDGRGGLPGKLNAAELQLELLEHVAVGRSRPCRGPRGRTRFFTSLQSFAGIKKPLH